MKRWYKILVMLAASLLLGALFVPATFANPPAQDPRPPTDSGGGGGGGGGDGGNGGSGGSAITCASIQGQVLNWGVGGLSDVGVRLDGGSWQLSAISNNEGNFGFGGLGIGIAKVQLALPSGIEATLQPLVQDAAVYLNCDFQYFANLALYSDSRFDPPASIEMSAPDGLMPGGDTIIRLLVKNDLPTEISNVIVTDLIPQGLTALDVQAATVNGDNAKIIDGGPDGQLVVVFLDTMAPGAEENILITVAAAEDLATGDQIRNTATLFYRESAADQDWVDFTIGAEELEAAEIPLPTTTEPATEPTTAAPETAAVETEAETEPEAEPAAAEIPAATPAAAESSPAEATDEADQGAEFVPPEAMPRTGESFLPPPAALPETGDTYLPPPLFLPETGLDTFSVPDTLPETGVMPLLPLAGLGFGGLAFVTHYLRSGRRKKE